MDGSNRAAVQPHPVAQADQLCGYYPATVDGRRAEYSGSLLVALRPGIARDVTLPEQIAEALHPVAGGEVRGSYVIEEDTLERLHTLDRDPGDGGRTVRLWLPAGLPAGVDSLQATLHVLRGLEQVAPETAYADLAVWGGPRLFARAPCVGKLDYLYAKPGGIDAGALWQRGYVGQDVMVADVEAGWELPHDDLDPVKIEPLCNDSNTAESRHGTAVLGILMARNNGIGGTGVAYGIDKVWLASHFIRGKGCGHIPEAIYQTLTELRSGDILLLEVQTIGDARPVEEKPVTWQAIRYATDHGITVIEAAGDGYSPLASLANDSGAVLVGSASSAVEPPSQANPYPTHRWDSVSNYGDVVNCYCWGDSILTTGLPESVASGTPSTPSNTAYRCDFRATSAAAAVIAGAAALLQCAWRQKKQTTLAPAKLRELLSTIGTAEFAVDRAGMPIGIMPDLEDILLQNGF